MSEIRAGGGDGDARRRWAQVAAGSFAVMAAALLGILLLTLEVIPIVLVLAAIFGALAYAVWRWHARRWVLALAAVLGVLAVVGNLPFIVEDLAHPETIAGFGPTVMVLLAALLGAAAAVAALVRVEATLRRPAVGVVAALAVVLVAISAVATLGLEDDERQAGDIVVVAKDVEFPERVEASAGAIAFFVDNEDIFRHTFLIEGEDVKQELPGTTARRVEVTLAAGSYRFYCDVPGHEDMEGTLEVS
jgi:plastocyanin